MHSFQTKLESISDEMEYYAISVPEKITALLKTHGPVPVSAMFNGVGPYRVNLYPVGGGRHAIRIKAQIRKEVGLKENDRVRVKFTVVDRKTETSLPKDVMQALKAERALEGFQAIPVGQRAFILKRIEQAAKPETREKRIQEAVDAAHERSEKMANKQVSHKA